MELLEIDVPIVQAPWRVRWMKPWRSPSAIQAPSCSLAVADLCGDQVRHKPGVMRQHINRLFNVNFFRYDFEKYAARRERASLASSHP